MRPSPLLPALVLLLALPARAQPSAFGPAEARHLLGRAGFGGTPEQIAELAAMGLDAAVDHLVYGPGRGLGRDLPAFDATFYSRRQVAGLADLSREERQKKIQAMRQQDRRQLGRYRAWWLDRMVRTPAPLAEKMVLFWHGHFTSGIREVRSGYALIQQNRLFREHALGDFRLLLHEITRDPAMLAYLDNGKNRKGSPNENFAREVMELFVLGAGNYTEQDIKEAARAFTGYVSNGSTVRFVRRRHDEGVKEVLGHRGRFDATDVLDLLLEQEAAPQWLARKLVRYFVGPHAPEGMAARYAALLREHRWQLAPVLAALFRDPGFYHPDVVGSHILSPVELLVGTARRLGEAPPGALLATFATQLGQTLFAPPNVKGWDGEEAWITTATFLQRGNLAGYVVEGFDRQKLLRDLARSDDAEDMDDMQSMRESAGSMVRGAFRIRWRPEQTLKPWLRERGVASAADVVDALCERFLSVPVTDESRASLILFLESGEEAFRLPLEYRLRRLVRLILSLPEAQLG